MKKTIKKWAKHVDRVCKPVFIGILTSQVIFLMKKHVILDFIKDITLALCFTIAALTVWEYFTPKPEVNRAKFPWKPIFIMTREIILWLVIPFYFSYFLMFNDLDVSTYGKFLYHNRGAPFACGLAIFIYRARSVRIKLLLLQKEAIKNSH